jgi:hypothetical protein
MLSLAAVPLGAGARPENSIARASAAASRGEPGAASAILEAALAADPGNQQLYRELSDLYDQRALSYPRALVTHEQYLRRFPEGRHAGLFRERQQTLQRHRACWTLLRDYRAVLEGSGRRSPAENMIALEKLLPRAAGTSLEPELCFALASQAYLVDRVRALALLDRCLDAPAGGRATAGEQAAAHTLRAQILREERRYREALIAQRRAFALVPTSFEERRAAERTLRRLMWTQWGFYAAALVFAGLLGLGVARRPWRRPGFRWQGRQLLGWCLAMLAVTLLPMAYLSWRELECQPLTFGLLAVLGIAGLLGLKLLAPLAARIGRPAQLGLSLLLVGAGLYLAYYLGGTLGALEWPFEAWRRMP